MQAIVAIGANCCYSRRKAHNLNPLLTFGVSFIITFFVGGGGVTIFLYMRKTTRARFKRRILHVPNLMQMSENNRFFSFALDSAHVKCDV